MFEKLIALCFISSLSALSKNSCSISLNNVEYNLMFFYLNHVNELIISYYTIINCNDPKISYLFMLRQREMSNKV